jgi:hypothetical protein
VQHLVARGVICAGTASDSQSQQRAETSNISKDNGEISIHSNLLTPCHISQWDADPEDLLVTPSLRIALTSAILIRSGAFMMYGQEESSIGVRCLVSAVAGMQKSEIFDGESYLFPRHGAPGIGAAMFPAKLYVLI